MPSARPRRALHPSWLTAMVWVFATVALLLFLLGFLRRVSPGLFPGGPNFEDIVVYKGRFTLYHTKKFFLLTKFSSFAYPAGAAPLYELIYKTQDAVRTYLVFCAAVCLGAALAAWLFLRAHDCTELALPLLALTYPMVFLVQRANIEIVLWLLVVLGLIAFRKGWGVVAAILFGIAAAMKLYPILLLGLFCKDRKQLPALLTGFAAAIVAMFAAIIYAGPTFAVAANGFFTGVNRFQDHYVATVSNIEVAFDHCLFSPAKHYAWQHHMTVSDWTKPYLLAAGLLALLLFLRVRTLPPLNRIVFLVVAMISLPPVSFAYTLTHLMFPVLLVIAAATTPRRTPTMILALALLLFLMLPLNALSALAAVPAGPVQAIALFLLLLLTATQPWPDAALPDAA